MKPYFWIPDIQDQLARSQYPSKLENFQPRIAQAIVRNHCDRIFAGAWQEKHFKTLREFYSDLWLPELVISSKQVHFVENQEKEFLWDALLRTHSCRDLEVLLDGYELTPYNNTWNTDKIAQISGAPILRCSHSADIINNKSIAQAELRKLWVTVPEGKQVFSEQEAFEWYSYLTEEKWYREVSFKLNESLNGMGVFRVKSKLEFIGLLEKFSDNLKRWILIDGWIENKISSPNIQYYVWKSSQEDRLIGCSDQILVDDGKEHIWNISDGDILIHTPGLQEDIKKILDWIRLQWAYGVVWIDFLITEQLAYFIEINGRYNGSTHGSVIAEKLWKHHWGTHDGVWVPEHDFLRFAGRLESDGLLLKDGEGILPLNPATVHLGKTMVLALAESKYQVQQLISHVSNYE